MDINSFSANKLPTRLQFEWNENWGNLIVLRLGNAPEKGDTNEKFKISICPNDGVVMVLPKGNINEGDSIDNKRFGNDAFLSEQNTELYDSSEHVYMYEDVSGQNELFPYQWNGEFNSLLESNLPKKLTPNKLTKLLNGKLFSGLYNYLKKV